VPGIEHKPEALYHLGEEGGIGKEAEQLLPLLLVTVVMAEGYSSKGSSSRSTYQINQLLVFIIGIGGRLTDIPGLNCNSGILDKRTLYFITNNSIRQLGYGSAVCVVIVL
jgi:hypothetical protein